MRSLHAGPVRLALLIAALAFASPAPHAAAAAQPTPDTAVRVRVDSADVNLTTTPSFTFAITIPTVMHFQTFDNSGQRYLRIFAISVDSLERRIHRAASYQESRPGIFTPLFETPRGTPLLGYVDRIEFERAVQRALRAAWGNYTLNRQRLT